MHRRAFIALFAAAAAAALSGCGGGPPSEPVARQFYQDIYQGNVAGYTALLAPGMRAQALTLLQGARGTVIPTTPPASSSSQRVGFNVSSTTGNRRTHTIAYEYPAHQVVFHTTLLEVPAAPGWQVVEFNYDVHPHQDVENTVRQFYRDLRDGNLDAVIAATAPASRQPTDREAYARIHEQIPAGGDMTPIDMGLYFASDATGDHASFRHRYGYPDRTLIVDTTLVRPRGAARWQVENFNFHRRPAGVTTLEAAPTQSDNGPAEHGAGEQGSGEQGSGEQGQ
jgi:hypothetical protein